MAMIQEKLKQLFQIVEQLETEYAEYNLVSESFASFGVLLV